MTTAAQIYTVTLAALQARELLVVGGQYKILSSLGDVKIFREGGSGIGPLRSGQGEKEPFNRLTLQDLSGAANTVLISVGAGTFIDDRVYGEVSVVDGELSRVLSNTAFFSFATANAGAGVISACQLWNPAGNTKRVKLDSIILGSPSATPLQLRTQAAALPTVFQSPSPSKNLAGASSLAGTFTDANAAVAGSFLGTRFLISGNVSYTFIPKGPILIPPGMGVSVVAETLNVGVSASFEFQEVP